MIIFKLAIRLVVIKVIIHWLIINENYLIRATNIIIFKRYLIIKYENIRIIKDYLRTLKSS